MDDRQHDILCDLYTDLKTGKDPRRLGIDWYVPVLEQAIEETRPMPMGELEARQALLDAGWTVEIVTIPAGSAFVKSWDAYRWVDPDGKGFILNWHDDDPRVNDSRPAPVPRGDEPMPCATCDGTGFTNAFIKPDAHRGSL